MDLPKVQRPAGTGWDPYLLCAPQCQCSLYNSSCFPHCSPTPPTSHGFSTRSTLSPFCLWPRSHHVLEGNGGASLLRARGPGLRPLLFSSLLLPGRTSSTFCGEANSSVTALRRKPPLVDMLVKPPNPLGSVIWPHMRFLLFLGCNFHQYFLSNSPLCKGCSCFLSLWDNYKSCSLEFQWYKMHFRGAGSAAISL